MATNAGHRAAVAAVLIATVLLVPAAGYGGYAAGRQLGDTDASVALPSAPPTSTAAPTATGSGTVTGTARGLSSEARDIASQATVGLSGPSSSRYLGSGTIVSPDGLVLTNAHVVEPTAPGLARLYGPTLQTEPDPKQVFLSTTTGDGPAEPTYLADLMALDGHLDLAVLKIASYADGTPLPADVDLPHVPLGSVDDLAPGDDLTVFGYPPPDQSARPQARPGGAVRDFRRDPTDVVQEDRYVVRSTADLHGGIPGAVALSNDGELVGVLLGEVEEGRAHGIRPVDLAAPLIESARTGATYRSPFVPGNTGNEYAEIIGWSGQEECATVNGERMGGDIRETTETGAGRLWLDGFAPGEDVLVALIDHGRDREQLLASVYDPADPCLTMPLPTDDAGDLVEGDYVLVVLAGPKRTDVTRYPVYVVEPIID